MSLPSTAERREADGGPRAPRVLICDSMDPIAVDVFREHGIEPEVRTGLDEDALVEAVREVEAIVVRSASKITRRVLEAAPRLRVVGRAGVGVDNVDLVAATERGVVVMNTPTGNTVTTGEHALALLFALARHVPRADREVRGGSWAKKHLLGAELTGKTLGVIGLGRIGRVVADRGVGLRMQVVAHDPYLESAAESPVRGAELVGLDELLARADFVTLHVPLTDATRGLLSEERIRSMKRGARLVNAARGGLVDEAAVARALDDGHLAGAAFDVLSEEPPGPDHPLVGRDDVVITPHLGASSGEAQLAVARDVARQIAVFLLEGRADNAVNAAAIAPEDLAAIGPYLGLCEAIGRFLAQRVGEPLRKLEVTWAGEVARHDTRPLALALQVGALAPFLDRGVNFVNAPLIAKEHGLRLLEAREEDADPFTSLVKVRASGMGGSDSHLVAGTVFGRRPRFVRVDDLFLDLAPEGFVITTRHVDRPGVVGALGSVLGEAGVNIRRIELGAGRDAQGRPTGESQGFLVVDGEPAPEVLARIAALEPIREVRLVRL